MNEENDFIMRHVKSFAEGLGAFLAKKNTAVEVEVVFPENEVGIGVYQRRLTERFQERGYSSARRLLESWSEIGLPAKQYQQLLTWLNRK